MAGWQDVLHADAPGCTSGQERRRAAGCAPRGRPRPGGAQTDPHQARKPILPGGDCPDPPRDGGLAGERGHYRLMQTVQSVQLPPTVQAMLAARIDRLLPEDKRLLQVAAVVGKDVPFTLLHAIADLSDEALRAGLE